MTLCLYRSDYGPSDPSFDPVANGGAQVPGFETHAAALATAQNLGQLKAVKREIQRGEAVAWCDQGYAWTRSAAVESGAVIIVVGLILPYAVAWATAKLRAGAWRRRPTHILSKG
jgi:hypothetical protein